MIDLTTISNNTNYETYLNRMTDSYNYSSKSLIPDFIKGTTVLDVGCGSGVLLEQLSDYKVEGIDLNSNSVEVCRDKGFIVHNKSLHDIDKKYDTIIFSSVLHEFSSYSENNRFTYVPIQEALIDAYNKLNSKGRIIIRDGVEAESYTTTVIVENKDVIKAIMKYSLDAPMFKNQVIKIKGNSVTANSIFLKEFMFTYTWGKESYHREVNEKFGILSVDNWTRIITDVGFHILSKSTYTEEYIKYLSKHFVVDNNLTDLLRESTILIIADRKD